MKINKSIFLLLLIGLTISSCEKVIDINIPDKSRKIVVNSIIDPESELSLSLAQSKSVLEDNTLLILEDAEAQVFEDGIFVGTMEYSGFDTYHLADFYPSIGKSYKIEVNHSVLDAVTAEVSIPDPVHILEMDTSTSIGEWGNRTYNVNLSIDDLPGTNYYAVAISLTNHIYDWENEVFLDSTVTYSTYISTLSETETGIGDDLIDNDLSFFIDNKLFFSDAIFSGQGSAKELALEYYVYSPEDSVLVDVSLYHIDKSYYYYSVSRQKYYRSSGNPFSEPVQVYNNIENGFGIFTSYTRTSKQYIVFAGFDR